MTCSHAIFRELVVDTERSLIVTAACAHCLHSWLICDAQHCVAGERPRLSHLPAGVAKLQVEQSDAGQKQPNSADYHPLCGEVRHV